ncbi:MAG: 2'-5' RNA ligase family protein [Pedobacter sp.]|nr:MAG: 2'-5' RNA ligase family protein [Pedobacter sp.]
MAAPVILTLTLDAASHAFFTELRTQHFPKHCNYLEAHLTLFHHLSMEVVAENLPGIFCDRKSMLLDVTAIKNIGNGVAFAIANDELLQMHKQMQAAFDAHLVAQDRQRLWPHVTIQNKVTAFKARQTADLLQKDFNPFQIKGIGISAWRYLDGPWEFLASYPFNSK